MQPSLPVPTDNLYKFAALFGLVLIIAAVAAFVVVYNSAYGELVQLYLDYVDLSGKDDERSVQLKKFLEQRINIAASNRDTYMFCIAVGLGLGGATSLWGFGRWARIQPIHDELLELEVTKARKAVHGDLEPHLFTKKPESPAKEPAFKTRFREWRTKRRRR